MKKTFNYFRDILPVCDYKVMPHRTSLYTLRIAFCLLVLYILAGIIKLLYQSAESKDNNDCSCLMSSSISPPRTSTTASNEEKQKFSKILQRTLKRIKFDLRKYNFTHSGARKLENLLAKQHGHPIRNLIVSTWRSGSTFFGEILNSVPGSFYHYEPLLVYGMKQIKGPPYAAKAVNSLRNMFKCNFSGAKHYFTHGRKHWEQFSHNTMLWEHCKSDKTPCYNLEFTNNFCKLFPFQSMKVLRVRLSLVEELLEDIQLNLRVMLLVRDPRGLMHSRMHWGSCSAAPDCWDPRLVCEDMVSNYHAASQLLQKYPTRLMILRYEDLALEPNETTRQVFKFLRLDYTTSVEEFLHSHGTVEIPGISSTYRITRNMPFRWKKLLDFESVHKIQKVCKVAMNLFGYRLAYSASHLNSKNFFPLGKFKKIN